MNKNIFKIAIDQLNGVAITDEEGKYIYVNASWSAYMGYKLDEIKGRYVRDIFPSSLVDEVLKIGKTFVGQPFTFENSVIKQGFCTYIPLFDNGKIIGVLVHVIFNQMEQAINFSDTINEMISSLEYYKQELREIRGAKYSIENIIGKSDAIKKMKAKIMKTANSNSSVLIEGETGSGKELVAHSIHDLSRRTANPFIKINCSAIPKELIESELFGYEYGAFTGAKKGGRIGKFQMAEKGSIFLDEINQLSTVLQPKILRTLQEREIEPIGSEKSIPIDVRIIAATNVSLEKLVKIGEFRSDLFYRLNVIKIVIPPLRDRKEDIPLLVEDIIKRLNFQLGKHIIKVSDEANEKLMEYDWPGNIRELQNVVERAMNMADSLILEWEDFYDYFENKQLKKRIKNNNFSIKTIKKNLEKEIISDALEKTSNNKTKTAKMLGISRTILYKKLKEYDI
ncbi:sigma-54 interaction domain-containing protein [Fusobacterium sp. PH5-44]|uniref:sigma-54 interaction domain-containing protein n=1 Tax=unclassified Fusobacterium TaxID=2648384 RepID=UPI003D249802